MKLNEVFAIGMISFSSLTGCNNSLESYNYNSFSLSNETNKQEAPITDTNDFIIGQKHYFQKLIEDSSWEALNNKNKPKKLEEILSLNMWAFEYESDYPKDNWQSPKKTIERQKGDCEDIALVDSYFAKDLGYSPRMIVVYDKSYKNGHALALLEEKKEDSFKYGAIDSMNLIKPNFNSPKELVEYLNTLYDKDGKKNNFGSYNIFDLNKFKGDWVNTDKDLLKDIKYNCISDFDLVE